MVQIESLSPGPILSARSVYNLLEGYVKQPRGKFQPSIKETLLRKQGNRKRLKKGVKRLKNGKKNLVEGKVCEGQYLIKMKDNVKPKRKETIKRKKTTVNKSQVERNSENGIKEPELKSKIEEDQLKPLTKHFQSDNSCSKNLNIESNIEENEDLEISEELTEEHIFASKILERIEHLKGNYLKPKGEIMKANKKKKIVNNSEKDVKISKLKKVPKESDSMPLLVYKDENATKKSKKNLATGKTKGEKVSELKTLKKTSSTKTKNFGESLNGNSSNNKNSSVEKTAGKKAKKRKLEDSSKKRNIEVSKKALQLVSPKNNLLTIFLTRNSKEVEDSQILGEKVFASLVSPLTTEEFLNDYWEKSHLLIRAEDKNRFKPILSTEDIDNILRTNNLSYTKNIDITSYVEGKRDTHNPEGRALASVVWDYYNSGCSIRMLNPQTFSNSVWKLLITLQELFNSFCGANVYLTPPGTQGFAPHWDDIEAFILQLEGKKRWKVYKWRSVKDTLPRDSSGNFGLQDRLGELLLDCVLEPGDLLYFPRGYIHQAEALDDIHSLHITISTYQKNAWVDLLEKLLPTALQNAAEKHVEFRQGLPVDYMYNAGIAYADQKTEAKRLMKEKIVELVNKMLEDDAPIDATVDQLAKGSVYDALPPYLTKSEKQRTIFEGGERWCGKSEGVVNRNELTPETPIRLLRRGCVRLLVEDDSVRLFHSLENSREYHEEEPKFIEISPEIAPGVEKLIHSYPKYINVEDLPLDSLEDKMILATGLWEKGIIISEHELDPWGYEEEDITSPEIQE